MPGKKIIFWETAKGMGFYFKKYKNRRSGLIEREDSSASPAMYLRARRNNEKGPKKQPYLYRDEICVSHPSGSERMLAE
jgi:hypothetical protein